ncbi:uncharacterized protein LOC128263342 [Drosophila gunungcola]|uniref:Uncharacterized protein n=1 Tax=Drosophila gunungcola TaxID=103775 RepID=A0A9P9YVJ3_9MUSC|nr:uncharacterized protein LOC128263342 [Drosophila gunungcola]KAI8043680.1 hypothetical protein M5D96_005013 [Drosophila gunungcola]
MLIPCLWTTLPWIVLGQTYYMSFVFNNYGPSRVSAPQLGLNGSQNEELGGGNPKVSSPEHSSEEETLEVSSLEHSMESKQSSVSKKHKEKETLELSSVDHSRETHFNLKPGVESMDSSDSDDTWMWSTTSRKRPTTSTSKKMKTKTTTNETPETPTEITTDSTMVTAVEKGKTEDLSAKPPEELYTDQPEEIAGITEAPSTDQPEIETFTDTFTKLEMNLTNISAMTWEAVTPHPAEFFDYPQAECQEDMDLHEVFGISLERDRGLPTKILCNFKNSWGGPWLLMTRIELPVRIHLRHWYFGYVTPDYKDININFLALAHIMNSMRTAMLIIGQDSDNKLVYNLYDDVVISAFNDLFMMRKAELVEANTTELLFVSVGKVMSSYAGRNRSCPLQVLGSWWGRHSVQEMYEGFFCVFPTDRDISRPGYVAIFIKPSLFLANHTAFYNRPISTRRPWTSNFSARLLNGTIKKSAQYKKDKLTEWERNKMAVNKELSRRARIFEAIDRLRWQEAKRHRGLR